MLPKGSAEIHGEAIMGDWKIYLVFFLISVGLAWCVPYLIV